MQRNSLILTVIILFSFLAGAIFYPKMPDEMASHWNSQGEVDGYISRFWGVFLMPIISFGVLILFQLIPRIDPLKENIERFRKYFDGFILILVVFLLYIYLLSILWNLGWRFNMTRAVVPSLGFLLFYIGILLENAKQNWFIGIRTPWTLSSEAVWEKTHRIGGKLFKAAGVITVLGIFIQRYAVHLIIGTLVLITLYTMLFSYLEYQKEQG